jgi:hypothetical protein
MLFQLEVCMTRIVLGISLLLCVVGCSPYLDDYSYTPRPGLADVPATQPSQSPPLSAYASIIGVRIDDSRDQIPESVEVALQLNNNGPQTATFNPRSFALSDGTLTPFLPPLLTPPTSTTLAPGQSTNYTAYFPFPPGRHYDNSDLNSLQLRWSVSLDGQSTTQTVMFRRYFPSYYYNPGPYYYGYPYPYWGPWYGGGVIVIRGGGRWR